MGSAGEVLRTGCAQPLGRLHLQCKESATAVQELEAALLWIFHEMPKPWAQITLLILLGLLAIFSVWTLVLCVWQPGEGRLFSPARWAGTVAGLAVCAAFFQLATTQWFTYVMEEFGDVEKFPYGPPSHVTRMIIHNPDAPIQSAVRGYLFFDPSLAAALGLWAGIFTVLSYWID